MPDKPATTSTPGKGTVQNECTLLADARETLAEIDSRRAGTTHYEGCRRDHTGCLLAELIREVERLREAIRRLADQDATLTDEERRAISEAAAAYEANNGDADCERIAAALTGLLARTGHVPDTRTENARES